MAGVAVSHHPRHVLYLVPSFLQQAVGQFHAFFHNIIVHGAVEAGFKPLLQFCFAEKALPGDLREGEGVQEILVDQFPGLLQAAGVLPGDPFVPLFPRRLLAKQGEQFQRLPLQIELIQLPLRRAVHQLLEHQADFRGGGEHMRADFLPRADEMGSLQLLGQLLKALPFHDNPQGAAGIPRLIVAGAPGKPSPLQAALCGGDGVLAAPASFKLPLHAAAETEGQLEHTALRIFLPQFGLPVKAQLRVEQEQSGRQLLRLHAAPGFPAGKAGRLPIRREGTFPHAFGNRAVVPDGDGCRSPGKHGEETSFSLNWLAVSNC